MSWIDTLRRVTLADGRKLVGATFRGVPFFVDGSSRSGGRRVIVHEFPGRDEPEIEDNGRAASRFTVQGYVLGDDYISQRDALLDALEDRSGSGELVHPYYGSLLATCSSLSIGETVSNGRMATFSLEFVRAPGFFSDGLDDPDHESIVGTDADSAITAATDDFSDEYDVVGQPSFATESLASEYSSIVAAIGDAMSGVVRDQQELARFTAQTSGLISQASATIRVPSLIVSSIVDLIADLSAAAEDLPREFIRALLDTYAAAGALLAPALTSTRIIEAANHAAISAVLRRIVAVEAARLLPYVDFDTFGEAISDRDDVIAALDDQASTAGDASYPALIQLRAAVSRAIPGDSEFARLIEVERRVAIPSLLLSHQLYGSVDLEADIIARNPVRHPGFIYGALEVLSDG